MLKQGQILEAECYATARQMRSQFTQRMSQEVQALLQLHGTKDLLQHKSRGREEEEVEKYHIAASVRTLPDIGTGILDLTHEEDEKKKRHIYSIDFQNFPQTFYL
jgi:hypothetical protein